MIAPLLVLLFTTYSCSSAINQPDCSKLEKLTRLDETAYSKVKGDKFVDFDWELSKEVNTAENGNIVISPISLKVVLAMLYEGAKGKTANEIADALGLTNVTASRMNTRQRFSNILTSLQTSKGQYEIKIGTHVFIDKNAVPKDMYQCKLQHYYNSAMEKVDFSNTAEAIRVINNWASNVTEGHIQHLISEAEDHSSTILLLLNAVYFKGLWQIPFPENETQLGPFYLNEKETVNVPLMKTTDRFYYYNMVDLKAQLIRLPYLGGKFSMYVVLPYNKTGLNSLAQMLGPDRPLTDYLKNMSMTYVDLVMPKFEFDFTTSLRPSLEKLNIKKMFTAEAELSDIAETMNGRLSVSNVLQKAGISVTEIGTVAYAATVVELMDKFGGDEDTIEFKADHPFLFFIEDESVKTTVFVGKVTNPEKAKVAENKQPPVSPTKLPSPTTSATPTVNPTQCSGTMCTSINTLDNRLGAEQDASQERFNYFDADLLKEMGLKESGNFVISPASVKTLLGLVLEAAEGSTFNELQTLLRLPQNITQARNMLSALQNVLQKTSSSQVVVDSVAQAFISKTLSINVTYAKTVKDYYKAEVVPQDFNTPELAANYINSWISTRTRGLIPSLIDQGMINSNTYAILTSAIYYDGKWKNEFQSKDTKEGCFYSDPDLQCHLTPMMMKNEDLNYKYDIALDSHVLRIPYQDERFSMVIVLPRNRDGMKQLTIDAGRLSFPDLLQNMNLYDVNLKLPQFTMEFGTELITTLAKMGLEEVFSDSAKLPYMLNNKAGRVSAIVHKARIEVNEKGTKAAAASGASVVPLMYGLDSIELEVNHPFYYFIYEQESQYVLFAGRLSTIGKKEASLGVAMNNEALVPLNRGNKPNTHGTLNYQYGPQIPTTRSVNAKEQTNFPGPTGNSQGRIRNRYIA